VGARPRLSAKCARKLFGTGSRSCVYRVLIWDTAWQQARRRDQCNGKSRRGVCLYGCARGGCGWLARERADGRSRVSLVPFIQHLTQPGLAIHSKMQLTLIKRPASHSARPSILDTHISLKHHHAAQAVSPQRRRKPTRTYCTLEYPLSFSSSTTTTSTTSSQSSPIVSPAQSPAVQVPAHAPPAVSARPELVLPPIPGPRTTVFVIPRPPQPLYWPFSHEFSFTSDLRPSNKPAAAAKSTAKTAPSAPAATKDSVSKENGPGRRPPTRATRRSGTQAAKRVQQQLEKEQQLADLGDVSPVSATLDAATDPDAAASTTSKRPSPRKKAAAATAALKRKRAAAAAAAAAANASLSDKEEASEEPPAKRTRTTAARGAARQPDDAEPADEPQPKPHQETSHTPEDVPPARATRGSRSSTRANAQKDSASASTSSSAVAESETAASPRSDKAPSKSPSLRKMRRSRSANNSPTIPEALQEDMSASS